MAPLEDNTNSNADLSDTETQSSDGVEFENENYDEDEVEYIPDTVPVDDIVGFGEVFETQVVDPDDEIPVMDLGGETQLVNLGGETQVLEELHCVENICTQVIDENNAEVVVDSDCEGTDKIEALLNTQMLSDDDSVKRSDSCSISPENLLKTGFRERDDGIFKAQSDASSDQEHHSGSVHGGFTSIRAASIRASGLAARKMALNRGNGKSYFPKSDCYSLKQHAADHNLISDVRDLPNSCKQINEDLGQEEHNEQMRDLMSESRFNICNSIVRRLFTEDECKQPDGGFNVSSDAANLPQLFAFEDDVSGLSYMDSQEPGESSQANALDFVDRFLKVNVFECDQDVDTRRSTGGKSKASSSAKGTQSLAKTAIFGNDGRNGIFDWDDSREDEGGGEFFRKKKDLFFDHIGQTQKSIIHPRKARCLDSKGSEAVEDCRDEEEEHPDKKKKLKDSVCSYSRVVLHKTRGSSKSSKLTGKYEKELDEQLNAVSGDGLVDTVTGKNEPQILGVGPDTQMAAEAMETLCFGVVVPDSGRNNAGEGAKNMQKGCLKAEAKNRVHTKQTFLPKEAYSLKAGVVTRQSKKTTRNSAEVSREDSLSSAQSKNVRKQCDSEAVKAQSKRPKLDAEKCFAKNDSGNISNACPKIGEHRKERRGLKKRGYDEIDKCHVTALSAQMHIEKRGLKEQLGCFTPVAHRTRRCREMNQITSAGKELNDSKDEGHDLVGVVARRKRSKLDANASETSFTKENADHAVELRNAKSVCNELSDSKCSVTSGALKIDAPDYSKGRRTRIKLPLNTQEANTRYNMRSNRLRTDATSTSMDVNNVVSANTIKWSNKKSEAKVKLFAEGAEATGGAETSPRDGCKSSASACTTPVNCRTPVSVASPICMGDEYHKQSCRKSLSRSSLMKELGNLIKTGAKPTSAVSDPRRRRGMADVRILFSHHLDADIIKQQKKILTRLGASEASSMSDATHFITDEFVRTRNMLEAIAFGKPVVTHLWLESCGQASCLIDEKSFLLRDARKEKQFGFSMPVSLARACQHPLLQGQRALITPNTKPGKEILASLVKAVSGKAVERLGRSALRDEKLPDDLLVLTCEEDYEICMPFLEKGAAVYSSELLLNGIVTQNLEYERHRLFVDHVKRTRSTIWVKKNNNQYLPVTRRK